MRRLIAIAVSTLCMAALPALAQEEAKHKLRFEIEYDDHVLDGV